MILQLEGDDFDPRTKWTIQACNKYNKLFLLADPWQENANKLLMHWIGQHAIQVLNVAGPSEQSSPGIGVIAFNFLQSALDTLSI